MDMGNKNYLDWEYLKGWDEASPLAKFLLHFGTPQTYPSATVISVQNEEALE